MQCDRSLSILINHPKLSPVEFKIHLNKALNGPLRVIRQLTLLGLFTITEAWLYIQLMDAYLYYRAKNEHYIAELINLAAEFNVKSVCLEDEIRKAHDCWRLERKLFRKSTLGPICIAGENYREKRKYVDIIK